MKKLKTLHLKNVASLNESEMKQVLGGSGWTEMPGSGPVDLIMRICNVGAPCSVTILGGGSGGSDPVETGTCQGSFVDGKVECYCDAYGPGSGSANSNGGVSRCYRL